MKRILCSILICTAVLSGCAGSRPSGDAVPEDFSFSLTWDAYGVSSYDSTTGKLVKTTDATHPEDYVTTYRLTEDELTEIYALIMALDVELYPDTYNPNADMYTKPSMTLILAVKCGEVQKTIRAENIAYSFEADNRRGQAFLDTCQAIKNLLTATDAWQALPDYEFLYQ